MRVLSSFLILSALLFTSCVEAFASVYTWTEQATAGSRNWFNITLSSDGTKLAAVDLGGYIYTSTD